MVQQLPAGSALATVDSGRQDVCPLLGGTANGRERCPPRPAVVGLESAPFGLLMDGGRQHGVLTIFPGVPLDLRHLLFLLRVTPRNAPGHPGRFGQ